MCVVRVTVSGDFFSLIVFLGYGVQELNGWLLSGVIVWSSHYVSFSTHFVIQSVIFEPEFFVFAEILILLFASFVEVNKNAQGDRSQEIQDRKCHSQYKPAVGHIIANKHRLLQGQECWWFQQVTISLIVLHVIVETIKYRCVVCYVY